MANVPDILDSSSHGIASFNMHGFNTGWSFLYDLCCDPNLSIIAIQEHWLSPDKLHLLNDIHPEFIAYGVSAMSNRLSSQIYHGRPFGGVAFLWRKSISQFITIVNCDNDGRCLCIDVNMKPVSRMFSVYFPCFDLRSSYLSELNQCLSFIEDNISINDGIIILGDLNFECLASNTGFSSFNNFCSQYGIRCCDDLYIGDPNERFTYFNSSLGHRSFIDHIFASNFVKSAISSVVIIDSGVNLSDHRPIIATISLLSAVVNVTSHSDKKSNHYSWRWDKSNLLNYYHITRLLCDGITVPSSCLHCNGCSNDAHIVDINNYYREIISSVHSAAEVSIVKISGGSLKPYWNDDLDRLKTDCIFWHNLWTSAGRPASGWLHKIKSSTKLQYKLRIKQSYSLYENRLNDELGEHFLEKRMPEFWKVWHAKFKRNVISRVHLRNCNTDTDTANEFAKHFSSVYYQSSSDKCAVDCFSQLSTSMADRTSPHIDIGLVAIEEAINSIKLGKACGPDDLSIEHFRYAHPVILIHLKLLFTMLFSHSIVPDEFGAGIIIPLLKDKSGNINSVDNYRGITLISVVSKIFENIILGLCKESLITDELQFGFKKGVGCSDAIFSLRAVIEHFISNRSSVFAAALDISKAFDRVNHFKLFTSLLERGLPFRIVCIISNWYSKLYASVKWNSSFSNSFLVGSGIRQGSIMSPNLFNIFINLFITRLRSDNVGCYVDGYFCGCFMYADDIILLSPSIKGLQCMLDNCFTSSIHLSLTFNCAKSHCICFGNFFKSPLPAMNLGDSHLDWCSQINYLGVFIIAGKCLKFDINPLIRAFYSACNSIYSVAKYCNELTHLALQESYCLPILLYGVSAICLNVSQSNSLNSCWNSVFRKIFGFNRWESVKTFIFGLGRLDLHHIISKQRAKFYTHLVNSASLTIQILFHNYCIRRRSTDLCLSLMQLPLSRLYSFIFDDFRRIALFS